MKPLPPAEGKLSQAHTSGIFLEKPGLLKEALKRNEEWDNIVPGSTFGQTIEVHKRVNTLEDSLLKLKEEQVAAAGVTDMIVDPDDDGQLIVTGMAEPKEESAVFEEFYNQTSEAEITLNIQKADGSGFVKQGESKDPVVVFIRHGRTPHNNLGLFTGRCSSYECLHYCRYVFNTCTMAASQWHLQQSSCMPHLWASTSWSHYHRVGGCATRTRRCRGCEEWRAVAEDAWV